MPKQTFWNLSQEKRQNIEQAALNEFAKYGFDNSNINRIVAQGKIAKGSFYQYFENKKDLYLHLIDTLFARKLALIEPILNTCPRVSLAHSLEAFFRTGLTFANSNPKLYLLGVDFSNKPASFAGDIFQKHDGLGQNIYEELLEHAQAAGKLYENADIPLLASFIHTLITQTSAQLIRYSSPAEQSHVIAELISFIERAIIKREDA